MAQGYPLTRTGSTTMRYALVMDVIELHYLVSLVVSKELNMQHMNVVVITSLWDQRYTWRSWIDFICPNQVALNHKSPCVQALLRIDGMHIEDYLILEGIRWIVPLRANSGFTWTLDGSRDVNMYLISDGRMKKILGKTQSRNGRRGLCWWWLSHQSAKGNLRE